MIVTIKPNSNPVQVKRLTKWITDLGLDVHVSEGEKSTVIGLVGDTSKVDIDLIRSLDIVEAVTRIQEPYKNANRKFHPDDTIVDVSGVKFGGRHFQMIAGPCSVETEKQVIGIAEAVKASGASMLRGGAFKPRTSPYAFQGLGIKGLEILKKAREVTGLPIVTEIMSERYIDAFADVDMVQIGARNMQNFDLLKAVGRLNKPVLLKRGLANTIEEWLMSAIYQERRKPQYRTVRKGNQDLRTVYQKHFGPVGYTYIKGKDPSSRHRRPQPRVGAFKARQADVACVRRSGRGRTDNRGP